MSECNWGFINSFTGILSEILAYQSHENFYDINFNQRSINEYLYNNIFSEDEINAINEYKKGRNFRASTRNKIFERQFENRRLFGWIKNLLKKEEPKKLKYEDLVTNKIFYLRLAKHLTDNLSKLTNVLDKFTKELKEKSIINATLRRKRSVNGSEILEATNTDNKNTDVAATTENSEAKEIITNGRRTFYSLDFKQNIISSINDTLNIVLYKFSIKCSRSFRR